MLAILSIIGVLSLFSISGLKIAFDKSKANALLHDAYLAFTEKHTITLKSDTDWESVSFATESKKQLFTRYDLAEQVYVLALPIEKGVCNQLLARKKEGELMFYNEDETPKLQCDDQNNIIFAFNGQLAPTECLNAIDCGETFEGYCNSVGRCTECTSDQTVSPDGTGCLCDETTHTTCSDETSTWCCPNDKLCGKSVGEDQCITSDGQCSGYFSTTPPKGNVKYYTDCAATFVNGVTSTKVSNIETTETIFQITQDCIRQNEYCNIYWTSASWELTETAPTINSATTQTTLYGKCRPLSTSSSSLVPSMGDNTLQNTTFREEKACPQRQYCLIKWFSSNCSSTLNKGDTGLFYGTCVEKDKNTGNCPY